MDYKIIIAYLRKKKKLADANWLANQLPDANLR